MIIFLCVLCSISIIFNIILVFGLGHTLEQPDKSLEIALIKISKLKRQLRSFRANRNYQYKISQEKKGRKK